ncbi:MAG: exodeoxyribonuclease VII large subunit [Aquabacterium sp.]|uniref:exodeoxyribonuclease VII large subunit n=1 Tax=Aquabacterium sp. TaxID=1872578 RepID=UPI00271A9C58|nr:exodeoxyribonuclease VII large subunit [Aquabacterium sp.]MDO9003900.1 exodeoxyribonuclease VII large subunit [Aquabacterium sp.]
MTARVWGVSALINAISDSLAARFAQCVVRGEISGFTRAASGHGYFTLKDENGGASLRCAIFRRALSQVDFTPGEGMLVEVRGNLSVYEARGELQMVVEGMQRAGAGALYEKFLRLKAKLEAEGLFDPARKRDIGHFPRRVAVVTSLAAAALRDVLTTLQRRSPHVEIVVAPCSVQGAEAPAQIVSALAQVVLSHHAGTLFDTVIVCRGGGSLEDLWAFNDERVVRAIAQCPIPVISGVGHETDVTLSDFAADLRAPTPTAAAELVAKAQVQALGELAAIAGAMGQRVWQRVDNLSQRLDQAAMRLARPAQALSRQRHDLALLEHRMLGASQRRVGLAAQALPIWQSRLVRAVAQQKSLAHQRADALQNRLHALDPQRVLERGYAWLSDAQGHTVTKASQAAIGSTLDVVLADGRLQVEVSERAIGMQLSAGGEATAAD